jgi:phospholipase/carboxylesterase
VTHTLDTLHTWGAPINAATPVAVLLHGRGGSALDMQGLVDALRLRDWSVIAPEATGHSWYPRSFLVPRSANQPWLDSAHDAIESIVARCVAQSARPEQIALIGFSQGACLALDHASRFARRYRAVLAFTGGLIGEGDEPFQGEGDLAGTPVYLGSSDPDAHVPWARVARSAEHLSARGARVVLERLAGAPHAVVASHIRAGLAMLHDAAGGAS